jgi:predicted PurR-regulated permease PerM
MANDWHYARKCMIAISLISIAMLVWVIRNVILLAFASILFAILLSSGSHKLSAKTRCSYRSSLVILILLISLLIAGAVTLFGAQLAEQIVQVFEGLPEALNVAGSRLGIKDIAAQFNDTNAWAVTQRMALEAAGFGYTIVGAIGYAVVVFIAAIYLAAAPSVYQAGLVRLFPPAQRSRVENVLRSVSQALRHWFGAQVVAMLLVGTGGTIAFWWIGLPSPVALGLIFGMANFVPYVGPIIGSIPALVFAATQGLPALLWTTATVLLIQQVEGYVVTPLLQQRAVHMPPALALFSIMATGVLFGFLGVILAVPLAVATMVAVQEFWLVETERPRDTPSASGSS